MVQSRSYGPEVPHTNDQRKEQTVTTPKVEVELVDPTTGQTLATVSGATPQDIDAATDAVLLEHFGDGEAT